MTHTLLGSLVIWYAIWALIWDKSDTLNWFMKSTTSVIAIIGGYLWVSGIYDGVFNTLWFIFTGVVSLYISYLWHTKDAYNTIAKMIWLGVFFSILVEVYSRHPVT